MDDVTRLGENENVVTRSQSYQSKPVPECRNRKIFVSKFICFDSILNFDLCDAQP